MLSPGSPEDRILKGIEQLGCAGNNFALIAGVVSKARFAQGLAGVNNFEPGDAEKMLEVLSEMQELYDLSQSPPDWKQTDQIRTALEERRAATKLMREAREHLEAWNNFMKEKHGNNYRT
jgi:hypothetical protein